MATGHAAFDLDGTLIDSAPTFRDILNAMLRDRGADHQLALAEVRPHAAAGGLAMVSALLGDRCGDPAEAIAEFRERYADVSTPSCILYPGAVSCFSDLRSAGISLSIVSNKSQPLCDKIVDELGLRSLVAAVVGSGPDVPLKPDPTGLDRALARAGAKRDNCCYIGDTQHDYALAVSAGVKIVMALWGYGDPAREWPGAGLARDFPEARDLVLNSLTTRVA